jgi:tetratricopeptide (TPR) repeat protein
MSKHFVFLLLAAWFSTHTYAEEPLLPAACAEPGYAASASDRKNAMRLLLFTFTADWDGLERESSLIVKAEPRSFLGWGMLGIARQGLQDAEGAIQAFQEAAAIRPHSTDARVKLARAYKEAGRYNEARREYATALSCQPDSSEITAELADIDAQQGDYKSAADLYWRLSQLGWLDYKNWIQAILAYRLAGEREKADSLSKDLKQASPTAGRCLDYLLTSDAPCCALKENPDCKQAIDPEYH